MVPDPPPPGGARHLVWLFDAGPHRDGLAALFTIEREIEESSRPGLEHAVGHARLDWWEEECALLARGSPRHPATRRLAQCLAGPDCWLPDLRPLVTSARWRFAQLAFENRAELDQALANWAETVLATALALGGAQPQRDPQARWRAFARRAGSAIREVEMLGALSRLAHQGLIYLPIDELVAARCSHEDCRRQPFPPPIAALLRARFARCASTLREAALSLTPSERRTARSALVWTSHTLRYATRATATLPMEYAPRRFAPLADVFAAWQAARCCLRGELPRMN